MSRHDGAVAQLDGAPGEGADTWTEPPSEVRSIRERWAGPEARVGTSIAGRYELLRVLGYGAAGAVYEALDRERAEKVAVKLLHDHLEGSDAHIARFAREVKATTCVSHSAVVRVFDAGSDGRSLYLVMELLDGELLLDRIEGTGLLPRDLVELGRQLLSALAAAHAHGVVHRDIKPENLFLVRSELSALRLKILDFGIAKLVRPDALMTFQTLDGLILGTPEYMSPETCRGMPVSEGADLWAAAAVLYHAAAGRPPFEEEHIGRLLMKIIREQARPLRELRPDLPEPFLAAVERALALDPSARWASAADFATALSSGSAPIDALDWDEL